MQITVFVQTNLASLWNGMRIAMALSIRDGVRRNPGLYFCCRRDVWKMGKERITRREEGSETQEPSRLSHEQIRISSGGYVKPLPLPETSLSCLGDRLILGEQITIAVQVPCVLALELGAYASASHATGAGQRFELMKLLLLRSDIIAVVKAHV